MLSSKAVLLARLAGANELAAILARAGVDVGESESEEDEELAGTSSASTTRDF